MKYGKKKIYPSGADREKKEEEIKKKRIINQSDIFEKNYSENKI